MAPTLLTDQIIRNSSVDWASQTVTYGSNATSITATFRAITDAITASSSAMIQLGTQIQNVTSSVYGTGVWPTTLYGYGVGPYGIGWQQTGSSFNLGVDWREVAPLSPAELEQARRADARRRIQRTRATRRGRRLLLRLLSDEQQAEYAKAKAFTVLAADGRTFRLRKGKTAELLGGDGNPVAAYCVHLPGGYIAEDSLIALLLTLQTDPLEFERIANVTPLAPRRIAPVAAGVLAA